MEELLGHYYFDRVCFLQEKIDSNLIESLLKEEPILTEHAIHLNSYLRALDARDFTSYLLITKSEHLKLMSSSGEDHDTFQRSLSDMYEDLKKIRIHKLDRQILSEKLKYRTNEISANTTVFLLEIKNIFNRRNSDASYKFSLGGSSNEQVEYYLLKLYNDSVGRFEMATEHFRLYQTFEERKTRSIFGNMARHK